MSHSKKMCSMILICIKNQSDSLILPHLNLKVLLFEPWSIYFFFQGVQLGPS